MTTALQKPRVGVQAAIIQDDRLLVVVKHYPEGTAYILPGGSQEHGETMEQAVRRECQEELGVAVTVERLLFVREYIGANHEHHATDGDLHLVNIVFAASVPATYRPTVGHVPDPDQVGVTWLSLATLHQVRFYPKALAAWLVEPASTGVYVGDIN